MSDLRERAAIAAMQGIIAYPDRKGDKPDNTAKWAVLYADALLAELARTTTSPVRPEPSVPMGTTVIKDRRGIPTEVVRIEMPNLDTKNAQPTASACTAAERELIEAAYMQETAPTDLAWSRYRYAMHSVRAERRAASEAKGGVQP